VAADLTCCGVGGERLTIGVDEIAASDGPGLADTPACGRAAAHVDTDWPGFTAAAAAGDGDGSGGVACGADEETNDVVILSDLMSMPAAGGALYRLNGAAAAGSTPCVSTATLPQSDTGLQSAVLRSLRMRCWLSLCCSWACS